MQEPLPSETIPDILPAGRTIKHGAAVIAGKAAAFLASFAVVTIIGKYVPRDIAGSYNTIIAALTIISIATLPGMNNALVRAIAKGHSGSLWPMMKRRLAWGLIGTAACALVGIISIISGSPTMGWAFLIAAPFVPITDTFSNFAISYWQGKKHFTKSAGIAATYYAGLAVLSIPIFLASDNLLVIVGGIMIAQALMGFLVFLGIRKELSGTRDIPSEEFGMHLSAMQALRIIAGNTDRIIVWGLFGPIMTAIYTFASTPVTKAYQLIPIGNVSLPHLSIHSFTQSVKRTILKKMIRLFALSIPATILVILLAPFIYQTFFPLYPESIQYFRILALPLALAPVSLLKAALTAFHRTQALYINESVTPVVRIVLMFVCALSFGLTGVAVAAGIASCIDFGILLFMFMRAKTEDT